MDYVKNAVRYPDESIFLKIGYHRGRLIRFKKTVGRRILVVIAEIRHRDCWIATGYYED